MRTIDVDRFARRRTVFANQRGLECPLEEFREEPIMNVRGCVESTVRSLATGVGLAAGAYATYAGSTWLGYGHVGRQTNRENADPLLDQLMPQFEVVERCQVRVAAPVEMTWSAACDLDIEQSAIVRGIFKARELILGGDSKEIIAPRGLPAQMKAWGWGVLTEVPGREIVFGAATQPWMANVVFRALPAEEFAAFREPGYVKIVSTVGARPINATESFAYTETRVATTDPTARKRFRLYWSCFLPGIVLIRRVLLGLVKGEAERRVRKAERRMADS